MKDILATELPKFLVFKKIIDKAITERFDGTPQKLTAYGLNKNDAEIALLLKDVMRTKGKRIRAYLLQEWYKARGGTNTLDCMNACIIIETLIKAPHYTYRNKYKGNESNTPHVNGKTHPTDNRENILRSNSLLS